MNKLIVDRINDPALEELSEGDNQTVSVRLSAHLVREVDALSSLSKMTRSSLISEILSNGVTEIVKQLDKNSVDVFFDTVFKNWLKNEPPLPFEQYEADLAEWEKQNKDRAITDPYIPKPSSFLYGDDALDARARALSYRKTMIFSPIEQKYTGLFK